MHVLCTYDGYRLKHLCVVECGVANMCSIVNQPTVRKTVQVSLTIDKCL